MCVGGQRRVFSIPWLRCNAGSVPLWLLSVMPVPGLSGWERHKCVYRNQYQTRYKSEDSYQSS